MAKYLHLFQNKEAHTNDYYGSKYFEPWVGCDTTTNETRFNKEPIKIVLSSKSDKKQYDGTALSNNVVVQRGELESGDSISFNTVGEQTLIGKGVNQISYTLNAPAGKYNVICRCGVLEITDEFINESLIVNIELDESKYASGYELKHDDVAYYNISITNAFNSSKNISLFAPSGVILIKNSFSSVAAGATVTTTAHHTITRAEAAEGSYTLSINATFDGETIVGTCVTPVKRLRRVILRSADDIKVYDGEELTNDSIFVEGDGFEDGEGATYDVTGSQTLIGTSENGFTYTLNTGTSADDYIITCVYGTLEVTDDEYGVDSDLVVTMTIEDEPYKVGDELTFEITVTNIYDNSRDINIQEIDGVTLERSQFEDVEPGATIETTATYTVTEADLYAQRFVNTVLASIYNGITRSATCIAYSEKFDAHATIEVETTNTPERNGEYQLGEVVTVRARMVNNGNVSIGGWRLYSEETGDDWQASGNNYLITPGDDTGWYEGEYAVTEKDILNEEIVIRFYGSGGVDIDYELIVDEGETVEPPEYPYPALNVVCETISEPANNESYELGEVIQYNITVTNSGNLSLYNVVVRDELTNGYWEICPRWFPNSPKFEPGAEYEYYTEYVVTEADILAGVVVNEAVADGENDSDEPTDPGSDTSEDPTAEPNPSLNVVCETISEPVNNETYDLGEQILYKITVTNNGNITIDNIVTTFELTSGEWTWERAMPDEVEEYYTDYIVTEADILNGSVVAEVVADGDNVSDEPTKPGYGESVDPTIEPNGHISVTKETTSTPENDEAYELGETIYYNIIITNNGNLSPTSDVIVTDEMTGDEWTIEHGDIDVSPGGTKTFEAQWTITEDDILRGSVYNIATVSAESPDENNPYMEVDDGSVEDPTVEPNGHLILHIEETSTPNNGQHYQLGETIEYNVWVENDGNLTITDINVTEEQYGLDENIDYAYPGGNYPQYRIGNTWNYEFRPYVCQHTVVQADILAGYVATYGTASGTSPDSDNPTVQGTTTYYINI